MSLPILAAVVSIVGVAGVLAAYWVYVIARAKADSEAASPSSQAPLDENPDAMERGKVAAREILRDISGHIHALVTANATYTDSLDRHRLSLHEAVGIGSLKELERALVAELDSMQRSNNKYRIEMEASNETVQRQQRELDNLHAKLGADSLTDIPNRRAFEDQLAGAVELNKRHGTPFSLLVIDIDHFKNVNDQFGHAAGDRILRGVAKILDKTRRASDFLARYGGEEFVILLPQTQIHRALQVPDRLRETVGNTRFRLENNSLAVTVSIGAGEFLTGTDTADSFFARVDQALYRAKHEGRNCVRQAEGPTTAQ